MAFILGNICKIDLNMLTRIVKIATVVINKYTRGGELCERQAFQFYGNHLSTEFSAHRFHIELLICFILHLFCFYSFTLILFQSLFTHTHTLSLCHSLFLSGRRVIYISNAFIWYSLCVIVVYPQTL